MTRIDSAPPVRPVILLVDDDPFMLAMQSQVLRGMGYGSLHTASSASFALDMLTRQSVAIDLIFCDLNMPGMDGIEFLQRLCDTAFNGSVILLSGEGMRIMHTVQKLLGSHGLTLLGAIEKPAHPVSLQALIDCWVPNTGVPRAKPVIAITPQELHAATREGQWVLHYQPKVDLQSGAVTGVEALVRWNHPVHGLVYPDSFIAMAEDLGAIGELTDWVLVHALQQLAQWRRARLDLQVSVNVSVDDLRAKGFAARVTAMSREAAVSPRHLVLEITESRLMAPSPAPLESLVRLRLNRFGLSIDDFGTGHSSLAQLRDVPFTELKVDRGFVQGARHNQIIRPILEGSIGIAKRLGMTSVAEGVETEEDWLLLQEIGCDLAQGYFIARPMAAELLEHWMHGWDERRASLIAG